MNCELGQVVAAVGSFVQRTRGLSAASVTAETPLFREGLIDSFGLIELIAELEKALGATLPDGALIPEDFESPQVLFERLKQV